MDMQRTLTIDTREPPDVRATISKAVKKLMGNRVVIKEELIEVGDYLWDDEIVVERKEVGDYAKSVFDGRVFTQCADMDQYTKSYVFVEGSFAKLRKSPYFRNFTVNRNLGSQCSILANTAAKILVVENSSQFATALVMIRDKHDNIDKSLFVERHSKTVNRTCPSLSIYLTIPGVGMKTAMKIVETYPKFSSFWEAYLDGTLKANLPTRSKKFLEELK
jgi:DNA excision repair protein ERCC-4